MLQNPECVYNSTAQHQSRFFQSLENRSIWSCFVTWKPDIKIRPVVTVRGAPSTITLGTWQLGQEEVEKGHLGRPRVLCHNIWEQDVSSGSSVTRPADCCGLIKGAIKHLHAPSVFRSSVSKFNLRHKANTYYYVLVVTFLNTLMNCIFISYRKNQ